MFNLVYQSFHVLIIYLYRYLFFEAIDFHMPPICSPLIRPGRPAEVAPVISKQLSDAILRQEII